LAFSVSSERDVIRVGNPPKLLETTGKARQIQAAVPDGARLARELPA
jgi:hypothetical protein